MSLVLYAVLLLSSWALHGQEVRVVGQIQLREKRFGWFLELNEGSQEEVGAESVHLVFQKGQMAQEGWAAVSGELEEPVVDLDLPRLHISSLEIDETLSLDLGRGSRRGILQRRLFAGPPEYTSIWRGDQADVCWLLELEDKSTVELHLTRDWKEWCRTHISQLVECDGQLLLAHTAHHRAPVLLEVDQVRMPAQRE